jgi:hypothetical protein
MKYWLPLEYTWNTPAKTFEMLMEWAYSWLPLEYPWKHHWAGAKDPN